MGRVSAVRKYRWPLLCCSGSATAASPAVDAGRLSAETAAQIEHGRIDGLSGEIGPKREVVALTMAAVTTVDAAGHIHGEAAAAGRDRGVEVAQGTRAVPLLAPPGYGFEAEQIQDLLHGDLVTEPVEVDSRHGFPLGMGRGSWLGGSAGLGPFRSLFL